jgi:hypothetical protein
MQLQQRINSFSALGTYLQEFLSAKKKSETATNEVFKELETAIQLSEANNGWFSNENILFSLQTWADALTNENLTQWTKDYNLEEAPLKTVALIMAGNIPLVGFHDFLSVLIAGHRALIKLSSNDAYLLPALANQLQKIEPSFKNQCIFTSEKLENFDAAIATGSNNSAKYFEYYFGKYPNIIRKNRNSIAYLTGTETLNQLKNLANDIFRYYGLGCRNVSKLYIPKDYNFELFFNAMYSWKHLIYQNKYMNNYDYNKAVYLMGSVPLLDNEFLLLKEDTGFSSPIAVLFYEKYDTPKHALQRINNNLENIQCKVAATNDNGFIPFGTTQQPKLWDYADGVDTLQFLTKL